MSQHSPALQTLPHTARTLVARGIQRLGFWGTVLLPLTYLPVLYGALGGDVLLTFAGLLGVNLLCLVLGHGHAQT